MPTSITAVKNVVRYIAGYYGHIDNDLIKDDWFLGKSVRDKTDQPHKGVGLDQFAIDHSLTSELNRYIHLKGGTDLLRIGSFSEKTTIADAAKEVKSRIT